jgi:hypothetical protein
MSNLGQLGGNAGKLPLEAFPDVRNDVPVKSSEATFADCSSGAHILQFNINQNLGYIL